MKIKEIKIREDDGSYSDAIPVGVDAINADMSDGISVEKAITDLRGGFSNLDSGIENLDIRINALSNLTPIPVNSIEKMTDTSKTYVNTIDGYWYYYDNTWKAGGQYQGISIGSDSVGEKEITDSDFIRAHNKDWNNLTQTSDGTGKWTMNYLYHKGYIKNIRLKILGEEDQIGTIYLLTPTEIENQYYYKKEFQVNGHGEIILPIDEYIDYDFILSTKIQNLAYKNDNNYQNFSCILSKVSDSDGLYKTNFKTSYVFAIEVEYKGPKEYILEMESQLNFSKLIKKANIFTNSNQTLYPIIVDFKNRQVSIKDLYIMKEYRKFSSNEKYFIPKKIDTTLSIPEKLIEEQWYMLFLWYDYNTSKVHMTRTNLDDYRKSTSLDIINNNLCLGYIYTNEYNFCTIGSINRDYFKVLLYKNRNQDDGTFEQDRIIPKYADTTIVTSELQLSKYRGKSLTCLGDSITKGEDSTNSYKRMVNDNIASVVTELLGFQYGSNYGIGGSRITSHSDSNFAKKGMVDRYMDLDDSKSDIITVWGGTNDFGANVDMGDLDDLSDNTKFKPAFYNLLNGLLDTYSNSKILVITPLHRKDSHPDNIPNSKGYTLKDYRDAEIEICELMGIPYLDLWSELGFTPFNSTMKTKYMPDGLHPNKECMRNIISPKIAERLLQL